ncbi:MULTISPECIES: GNAT family N-acetyltransferase [Flavobacteriaceae]|uniref:GNAT family N-acetyltransferase n=1 Tax=Flavobacteriaceae TaxID=49546 RepID=UPI001491B826|nr:MULTISPECIES: GNAT family N-acetyltransferase [Allomuricauda]MDC6365774.1 GNAT family N-acetyltransferase [Muricauda sp. AC10]
MEHYIDEHITLVPISMDYAKDMFASFNEDIIKFLPLDNPPSRIEETKAFVEHSVTQMQRGNDLVWVILYDNVFAGCCGIHSIPSKQPHFGLWVKKEMQGKGIGKKVVGYGLHWGINNLDVEYIKYPVDKRNTKSLKLIEDMRLKLCDHYLMGNTKKLQIDEYRIHKK